MPGPDHQPPTPHRSRAALRVALFTDTLGDVNGVSRFIRTIVEHAGPSRDLHVLTSTRFACPDRPNIRNIPARLARPMPGYATLDIVAPNVAALRRAADELCPDVIHVSTPGPVGLAGRRYALKRGLPLVGTYHTDFPAYIDNLFGDAALAWLGARAMRWFYRPFSRILARSHDCEERMARVGIAPERIVRLPPGIDTQAFHARRRAMNAAFWRGFPGVRESSVKVLYVGRVSVEKNLGFLGRLWGRVRDTIATRGVDAQLLIVGDGPHRAAMERELLGHDAVFLGFRHGHELGAIYASSDLFVFPSTTDTLGQVVMEAQASGLPTLVSDQGGPRELVRHGETGFVLPVPPSRGATEAWTGAMLALIGDAGLRARMGAAGHAGAAALTIARSFDRFWTVHEEEARRASAPAIVVLADGAPAKRRKPGHTLACGPARRVSLLAYPDRKRG